METRYYTKYNDLWFAIAGDDDDPVATIHGRNKPSVNDSRIRRFGKLPENEKSAIKKELAEAGAEAIMEAG